MVESTTPPSTGETFEESVDIATAPAETPVAPAPVDEVTPAADAVSAEAPPADMQPAAASDDLDFLADSFFEPWAEAAVTETEAPADTIVEGASTFEVVESEAPAAEIAESLAETDTTTTPMMEGEPIIHLEEIDARAAAVESAESETVPASEEAFPLDAFLLPQSDEATADIAVQDEQDKQETAGFQPSGAAQNLAERLERLTRELRAEDANAVIARLARGDKLDTLLAGLLAGFVAGSGEER